jgi:hypothetical protein
MEDAVYWKPREIDRWMDPNVKEMLTGNKITFIFGGSVFVVFYTFSAAHRIDFLR